MTSAGQGDPTAFEEWSGDVGCLLLHGFPGSPAEVRELGTYLGRQGISVAAPCLPGFGQRPEDLEGVRWIDWLRAAAQSLRSLRERCQWVCAAGLSMGAMLALYLAAEVPVEGIALVSPAVQLRSPLSPLIPIACHLVRWYSGGTDRDLVDPTAPQRQWYYTRVPGSALGEMYALLRAARRVARHARVPALLIQSRSDAVLRPEGAESLLEQLESPRKRLLWVEHSGHNILVDAERERVFAEIGDFVRDAAGLAGPRAEE